MVGNYFGRGNDVVLDLRLRDCGLGHSNGRRAAFTLVELLVVIGIIALLISILLPSLNSARESAKRIQCLSNVRQLTIGLFAYTNDNKGAFPGVVAALPKLPNPYEWVRWELNPVSTSATLQNGGKLDKSIATQGIGRYIGLNTSNVNLLRCPSDFTYNTKRQTTFSNYGDYTFSYVMNYYFTCDGTQYAYPFPPSAPTLAIVAAKKITAVKNSSLKIIVYEQDHRQIDDSFGRLWDLPKDATTYEYNIDRLSLAHDRTYGRKPDPLGTSIKYLPNSDGRGVVGFVDGHSEFVTRKLAHSPGYAVANEALYPKTVPVFDYR